MSRKISSIRKRATGGTNIVISKFGLGPASLFSVKGILQASAFLISQHSSISFMV